MSKIYRRPIDRSGSGAVTGVREECAGSAAWLAEHGGSREALRELVLSQYEDLDGFSFDDFNGRLSFPAGFEPEKACYTVLYFDGQPLALYETAE